MPQRTIWCVCEYHRALTLQRGDAPFIVLPSVTSVCVFSCLKASPTPPCLLHGGVPCASLASSPVHTAEQTHLIGQGLPWEVLGDASLIYYTHTSQGHQRKGILSTPPRVSLPLSLLLSPCSHMPNRYTKAYIHTCMAHPYWSFSEVLFNCVWHLGLLLFCIVSLLLTSFTPSSKWLISPPTGELGTIINRLASKPASGFSLSLPVLLCYMF